MHPVQATVDEASPDTESGQLRSEGQPSRPGTDHENLDQPASHDATLRPATGADAATCPGTVCPALHHLQGARLIAVSWPKADS